MTLNDRQILGGALVALGLSASGFSAVAAGQAIRHMAEIASLCGPQAPHCGWCLAAAASAAAALVAFAAAARLTLMPAPLPLRARR